MRKGDARGPVGRLVAASMLLVLAGCTGSDTDDDTDDDAGDADGDAAGTDHDATVPPPAGPDEVTPAKAFGLGPHAVAGADTEYGPNMTGYLSRPDDGRAYPGVVMIHEWWGLNDHVRQMADVLASRGYAVLAVDLFGTVASTADEARAQTSAMDQEEAIANMQAAVAYLRDEAGAAQVASLGWCFGGGQSLQLALSGETLSATVLYYGQPVTDPEQLAVIDWPVLGVFGAEDASIPLERVDDFRTTLDDLGVENDIHVYDGVGHAFANPSNAGWDEAKATDAWGKTLAFLDRSFTTA